MALNSRPPEALLSAVVEALGDVDVLRCASLEHGEAEVWELGGGLGARWFLKRHRHAGKLRQEMEAYALLAEPMRGAIPEVVWRDEGWASLVTTAAPGVMVAEGVWSAAELAEIHALAGAWRSSLDAVTWRDDDRIPLAQAVGMRVERWCHRAAGHVEDGVLAHLRRVWSEREARFAGCTRRFCHRDFSPRNWCVAREPGGLRLTVIDLGQARGDHPLVDSLKIAPEHVADFERGLGRRWREEERAQREVLLLLHGVATLSWGLEHGDAEHVKLGRDVIAVFQGMAGTEACPTWAGKR